MQEGERAEPPPAQGLAADLRLLRLLPPSGRRPSPACGAPPPSRARPGPRCLASPPTLPPLGPTSRRGGTSRAQGPTWGPPSRALQPAWIPSPGGGPGTRGAHSGPTRPSGPLGARTEPGRLAPGAEGAPRRPADPGARRPPGGRPATEPPSRGRPGAPTEQRANRQTGGRANETTNRIRSLVDEVSADVYLFGSIKFCSIPML